MRGVVLVAGFLVVVAVAGCETEKQWMKVGEPYTTNEFRRDYSECSKTGRLDEECMRGRGWVEMKPSKGDRASDTRSSTPQQYSPPPRSR